MKSLWRFVRGGIERPTPDTQNAWAQEGYESLSSSYKVDDERDVSFVACPICGWSDNTHIAVGPVESGLPDWEPDGERVLSTLYECGCGCWFTRVQLYYCAGVMEWVRVYVDCREVKKRQDEAAKAWRKEYYKDYIASPEWRLKANEAKGRAGHRCQVCNKPSSQVTLDAHHRTYERLGNELPEDITVLCRKCHSIYHRKGQI